MNTLVKYGIFWEPSSLLKDFILQWKQRVRETEPAAVYLEHPVHATFFLFMAGSDEQTVASNSLADVCAATEPFEIKPDTWHVFRHDAATGGDTLAVNIQCSEKLFNLQYLLAKTFSPLRKKDLDYDVQWQGSYLESQKEWGFPFVGKHWVPHLTIASVKDSGKKIIDNAILSADLPGVANLDSLSLYRIEGDLHTCIKQLPLNTNAHAY